MRDELVEALTVAAADPGIARVELRGEGRAFCAGGDLDEFGTRADPATAHLVRLQRSVGRALFRLDKPTVTYLHGACMGSGIELAAFTDVVVAAEDTQIGLPEIGLGLVPGAGGTVSLPSPHRPPAHGVAGVLRPARSTPPRPSPGAWWTSSRPDGPQAASRDRAAALLGGATRTVPSIASAMGGARPVAPPLEASVVRRPPPGRGRRRAPRGPRPGPRAGRRRRRRCPVRRGGGWSGSGLGRHAPPSRRSR